MYTDSPSAIVAGRRIHVTKARLNSWEVSDAFWQRVEPLIPLPAVRSEEKFFEWAAGGGRKPKDPRLVFEAIVYVLRTGCQWKALPREGFGGARAIPRRRLAWGRAGAVLGVVRAGGGRDASGGGIAW